MSDWMREEALAASWDYVPDGPDYSDLDHERERCGGTHMLPGAYDRETGTYEGIDCYGCNDCEGEFAILEMPDHIAYPERFIPEYLVRSH